MTEQIDIPASFAGGGDVTGQAGGDHRRRPRPRPAARARVLAGRRAGWRSSRAPRPTSRRSPTSCPGPSLVLSGDVTDEDFNEAVADATVAEWGGVDVWICNAGISPIVAGPRETDPSVWREILDVNLTGAFLGARAAARVMGDGGRLIFTGSVLGERPRAGLAAYSASKAGLVGLAKGLALDLAPAGITVNVVAPGWFDSPLAERVEEQPRARRGDARAHRAAALGRADRPRRRVPVPRVRRVGVRHRHRAQRRRRVPARMSADDATRRRRSPARAARSAPRCRASSRANPTPTSCSATSSDAVARRRRVDGLPERRAARSRRCSADVSDDRRGRSRRRAGGRALRPARRADQQRRRARRRTAASTTSTTEDWERAFRVNVLGAVNGIRAAVPVMRAQQSGSIILTASVVGAHRVVARGAVLRDEGRGDPAREGRGGRVRRATGSASTACARARSCRGSTPTSRRRRSTRSRPSTRSGSGRPTTSSARTRTSRATRRAGRPARRSSSTAATPRRRGVRRDASGHELVRRARAPRAPHARQAARRLRRRRRHLRRDGGLGRGARRPGSHARGVGAGDVVGAALVQQHRVPGDDLRRQPPRRDRDADQLAARRAGGALHPRALRGARARVRRGARRPRRTRRRTGIERDLVRVCISADGAATAGTRFADLRRRASARPHVRTSAATTSTG